MARLSTVSATLRLPLAALLLTSASASALAQEPFDLDALVEAARAEPPITVYAVTGKIVDTARAFTQAFGVQAEGRKVSEADQVELMIREGRAGNVVGDVSVAADTAAVFAELLPNGMVESWVPGDMAEYIDAASRDPLILFEDPQVFTYNAEVHESCPVDNIWALTEPEWSRKVAMLDPLVKPNYADWFNQMEAHHDDAVRAAYEAHFGRPLETDEASATAAFVKAFAGNQPLLADSSGVAEAIGAPGQSEPFFGLTSPAKYRENESAGFALGLCAGMAPFSGWLYPAPALIAAGTDSPNAARLFVHYLLTADGFAPQAVDGKVATNALVPLPEDEASGIGDHLDEMMRFDTTTAVEDFDRRQDWQDFWRIHYSR